MATVYLARVRVVDELYRNVAVKLMHPYLRTEDGTWTGQLIEEAKVAASIQHPNVVPVLEVGEDGNGVFLVMEYVEGDTLSGLIRAARAQKAEIPLPIVARILADALTGLHAAHELVGPTGEPLQLVHRDFSPQNVLVGTDGVSRLTDFGIAKIKTSVGVTASGVIKGKIGYMAPEQALGRPLDRRCDVWAAGVVAWELLALRRLFKEDEQVATLLRIVSAEPPRVRSVRADVPEVIDDVIASALEVVVERRCPSADELRRRLLEAWYTLGPVAETAEVGEYVRGMVGAKLAKRKSQTQSVIALRKKISNVSEKAIAIASTDGFDSGSVPAGLAVQGVSAPSATSGAPVVTAEATEQTTEGSTWSRPSGAARWKGPAIGLGVVSVVVVVVGLFVAQRTLGEGVAASAGASAALSGNAEAPSRDAPVVSDAASSAEVRVPVRTVLRVRSDVPMTGLQIGERGVALAKATRELEVQLTEGERESELKLMATARGRPPASVVVPAGAASVELRFPEPVRIRPTSLPPDKKPPGLAPPPYEVP